MTATRILLLLLVAALAAPALAGELSPGLQRLLAEKSEDDVVRVLVVLSEQVDAPAMAHRLHRAKTTHATAHRQIVSALQQQARASQGALLADLAAGKSGGAVLGYRSHWLVNAVVVTAPVATVRALAVRPDVERIEPDLVVDLVEPVSVSAAAEGIGTTPGLRAVNAPRVWEEFGIDGTGVVVGSLDSGVDGQHPALAARWRGLVAPPEHCWLDAANQGDTFFPVDRRGHGTHTMGTLTGLAPDDTIGVAPGARWIATNVIVLPETGEVFDNAVLASLEFMTDPDGDPNTVDDVPAVVQNSWGINESWEGYLDCDSRWWDAIDACEAAGVVLIWSAGNEGPGPGTLRSPADRATTPTNAFAVGSVFAEPPYQVSGFSSRGPSGCGDGTDLKPQLVAPGSSIYSAAPGGGYNVQSGTSMAGPHVAGVVALMRAANPEADVLTIKQALLDTARDLGDPGPDMDSGYGLVDAHAAVLAVMDGVGIVSGRVTDSFSGMPLVGALVARDDGLYRDLTDADGRYRIAMPQGSADFTVTAFGHEEASFAAEVTDGGEVVVDRALAPLPFAHVSGRITGEEGEPIGGATVTVLDAPVGDAVAAPDGSYLLALPIDPDREYVLRARADGYGSVEFGLTLTGSVTRDIVLPAVAVEDFESGDFSAFPWRQGGDAAWSVVAEDPGEGLFSARSGAVADGGRSELSLVYDVLQAGDLAFHLRVSSEADYDHLVLYVDGVLRRAWSGEVPWGPQSVPLTAGRHAMRWVYVRDDYGSGGADAAWLDLITFPPADPSAAPLASASPAGFDLVATPGSTQTVQIDLVNDGDAELVYGVAITGGPASATNPVTHLGLGKGEADPRPGHGVATGAGGPDLHGYVWSDDEQPGGPQYSWLDTEAGTVLAAGDDESLGPFALAFPFPFYDEVHEEVWISSNGFLSFGGPAVSHQNQGIPDPAAPDGLVAPFWDDLDPALGGALRVLSTADRFVVEFAEVPHFGDAGTVETFQVALFADGEIRFQYAAVGDDGGCTVGLEDPGGADGLLVRFNTAGYLHAGRAIRIARLASPAWLTVVPEAGIVPAGQQAPLEVEITAPAAAGAHAAYVHLTSNDPSQPVITVPVTLTVEAADGPPTGELLFGGAVPNPFNPQTEFRFSLPAPARVDLRIFDVAGRRVRTLVAGTRGAGPHTVTWRGRDDGDRLVASGTYFAHLRAADRTITRAVTLVR